MALILGGVSLALLLPVLTLWAGPESGPARSSRGPESYQILMVSRQFTPDPGTPPIRPARWV